MRGKGNHSPKITGVLLLANSAIFFSALYLLDDLKYLFTMTYCLTWVFLVWAEQRNLWYKIPLALALQALGPLFTWIPMFFLQQLPSGFPTFLIVNVVVTYLLVVCLKLSNLWESVVFALSLIVVTIALYSFDTSIVTYVYAYLVLMAAVPVMNALSLKKMGKEFINRLKWNGCIQF